MPTRNRAARASWTAIRLLLFALLLQPTCAGSAVRNLAEPISSIHYSLEAHIAGAESFLSVGVAFSVSGSRTIDLQIPTWAPGDYHLQNFQRYIRDFHVVRRGAEPAGEIPFEKPDDNTWEFRAPASGEIEVSYRLPETPPGFFSENVQLRADHAYINGPAALMYVVGAKQVASDFDVRAPVGWSVWAPLPIREPRAENEAVFGPADYDTLADSPILVAEPDRVVVKSFDAGGKQCRLLMYGRIGTMLDADEVTRMLTKVVNAETRIMQGFPARDYTFFLDVGGRGGGLEHLNSCRIALPPMRDVDSVATFFSHEFFHLWNVKRIRPKPLGPFDYVHPPRTRNLWFAEGVTEYYANVAARRAGIMSENGFLAHWREAIHELTDMRSRVKVSADESSLRVWEAGNSSGYGISYYRIGELIGLCLDLKIRHVTDDRKSLDDVMRYLMRRYGSPHAGYGEDDLRAAVSEVAGVDLGDFYDRLARSTEPMPFAECLSYAGLNVEARPIADATRNEIDLERSWSEAFDPK